MANSDDTVSTKISYEDKVEVQERPYEKAFDYTGRMKPLAGIQFKNLLLILPTLGVYRFWALSRLRRYFWSSTKFDGTQLEYTGVGKELFMGLLLVLGFLIPLGLVLAFLTNFLFANSPGLALLLYFVGFLFLMYLAWVGYYLKHRYIMSRTRWRGIRFAATGSPWKFGFFGLGQMFLVQITFSLYTPFASMAIFRRLWSETKFGDEQIEVQEVTEGLMSRFLLMTLGSYLVILPFLFVAGIVSEIPGLPELLIVGLVIIALIAWVAVVFRFVAAYRARIYKCRAESLKIQEMTFKSTLSGADIYTAYWITAVFVLAASLLVIFLTSTAGMLIDGASIRTLIDEGVSDFEPGYGLSGSWIVAAFIIFLVYKFASIVFIKHAIFAGLANTTDKSGEFNPDTIAQSDQKTDSRGEGLATALEIDVGGF